MASLAAYVAVVAMFCAGLSDAIAPCKKTIIDQLGIIPECYRDGKIPRLLGEFSLATFVMTSKSDITPNVSCVLGTQNLPYADVNVFFRDKSSLTNTYYQERQCKYILETDIKRFKYHIYVTHNSHGVYAYYRCIPEHEKNKGNGADMMAIAVSCDCLTSKETLKELQRAKICFNKLNITDTVPITPCHC